MFVIATKNAMMVSRDFEYLDTPEQAKTALINNAKIKLDLDIKGWMFDILEEPPKDLSSGFSFYPGGNEKY